MAHAQLHAESEKQPATASAPMDSNAKANPPRLSSVPYQHVFSTKIGKIGKNAASLAGAELSDVSETAASWVNALISDQELNHDHATWKHVQQRQSGANGKNSRHVRNLAEEDFKLRAGHVLMEQLELLKIVQSTST